MKSKKSETYKPLNDEHTHQELYIRADYDGFVIVEELMF